MSELRRAVAELVIEPSPSRVREIVADVCELHADAANADALLRVASQFNLLEMTGPAVTPERGVGIYENDPTQGPACAIACGAGTTYRNYFARVDDSIGHSAEHQIDCSADLGSKLGNHDRQLWQMQNGYLFTPDDGLRRITDRLQSESESKLDELRGELRIGLQWQADVTLSGANHKVSQAYSSAPPVAYGRQGADLWTDFARLILGAAYEATLLAAVINASRTGVNTVHLTLLAGSVFGNNDASFVLPALCHAKFYVTPCRYVSSIRNGESRMQAPFEAKGGDRRISHCECAT